MAYMCFHILAEEHQVYFFIAQYSYSAKIKKASFSDKKKIGAVRVADCEKFVFLWFENHPTAKSKIN